MRPREEYRHLAIMLASVAALRHVFFTLKKEKTEDKENDADIFKRPSIANYSDFMTVTVATEGSKTEWGKLKFCFRRLEQWHRRNRLK